MTKSLLKQVMLKEAEKKEAIAKQNIIFNSEDMIAKIRSGYTVSRGPKMTTKKTFAPSTIAYQHGQCPRYWYLAFNGNVFDDYTDAYGVANMSAGTMGHERIQKAMLASGVAVPYINDKGEKTTEFKVIANDPPIFGYGDVMFNWEGEEIVGEIKTMMSEAFEYRKKTNKPKGAHLIQLLIYMKILGKSKGALVYENKNNHDLLIIPVEVNDGYRQWVDYAFNWMREVRNAWEGQTLPTKNYRNNSKICKTCPVKAACIEAGEGTVKIASLEELSETLQ
jgi:CRISPR/Cas system-associated exonuclease Cas4 (RecB family)